jgi:tetratricopeptide (TPR) repeat protein
LLKQTIRQIVADMPTAITIGEDQFDNTVIYLAKKASYLRRKGQYGEAIEVGKKCIALTPSLHAYNALISSALRLGQLDVAVRHYEDALAYFPANKLVRLPKTTRNLPSPYAQ